VPSGGGRYPALAWQARCVRLAHWRVVHDDGTEEAEGHDRAMTITVERQRTAMNRTGLSKPMSVALADGLLPPGTSIFDYGCGRGGDVLRLAALGYDTSGWDPGYAADSAHREADVVNLGYVINVIEDSRERVETLHSAWSLARQVLVVAARPDWEARHVQGRRHGDGILTTKGTFQKFFKQEELGAWIDSHLGVRSIAAAPGIFYVFRDEQIGQRFLAQRVRHRPAAFHPEISDLYEAHRSLLQPLIEFTIQRGRLPDAREIHNIEEIKAVFGSAKSVTGAVRQLIDSETWDRSCDAAKQDLVVYLALAAFRGRAKFRSLPEDMQLDIRAHYGTYKKACEVADKLLFSVADQDALNVACASASFGKLTPEALYVHVSTISQLSSILRVYEGCGRALAGAFEDAVIIKLNRIQPKVSYLSYPGFDKDPHPILQSSLRADLSRQHVKYSDFSRSNNPPLLHRKETFVPKGYPHREKFSRLTRQEERAGLLDNSSMIGTTDGWQARLHELGFRIAGHRLLRRQRATSNDVSPPSGSKVGVNLDTDPAEGSTPKPA
jgi:DNA phosphorothioation-associated putative methyltransferase